MHAGGKGGFRRLAFDRSMRDVMDIGWKTLIPLAIALVVTSAWLGVPPALGDDDASASFPPVSNALTLKECGSCHMPYPAALLPARVWQRMMSDLEHHFDEDASLDVAQTREITRYLTDHAADSAASGPRARKWAETLGAQPPLRITETRYFGYLHDEVPSYVWKRSKVGSRARCDACHTRATEGRFQEREIRIPK